MKQRICSLIILLCILLGSACADVPIDGLYTDVPSVMTQDALISVEAWHNLEDRDTPVEERDCTVTVLQPDEKSSLLLEDVFEFVWREDNRPVRYYDEETQQKIQDLVPGLDIDILHMTEFMNQDMDGVLEEDVEYVHIERLLDVDYRPEQLVIVVLGIDEDNDGIYRWFPYRAHVPETGLIEYDMPAEDFRILEAEEQMVYHVLTDRIGARGEVIADKEVIKERVVTPSKGAHDIIRIRRWYSANGEKIDDLFSIFLVDKTREIKDEINRIGDFLWDEELEIERPAIEWFPEEIADQAQLLIEDVEKEDLIIYDIVAVQAKDYKDTYGDVATESLFAAAYSPDRQMVAMLGFPLTEVIVEDGKTIDEVTHMEWFCLRAEALEQDEWEYVEIVFKQLVIPEMEEQPTMLVVLSEPLEEEIEEEK